MPNQTVNVKNEEYVLRLLLKVEAKEVNLKFVFDHIRNYGICGVMLGIGVKVLAHPDNTNLPGAFFDMLAGGILFALPWALFALNFGHGISAFFAIREANEVNKYWYLGTTVMLFFPAMKLMIYALNLK